MRYVPCNVNIAVQVCEIEALRAVHPTSKLHLAGMIVEWEVFYVHVAVGCPPCVWRPKTIRFITAAYPGNIYIANNK